MYREEVDPPHAQDTASDLTFTPSHALCKLRALWSGTTSQPLTLSFSLPSDDPAGPRLPPVDLAPEPERLRLFLSYAAQARLAHIAPDRPLPALDEEALVFVSRDQYAAWLLLLPPVGEGAALTTPQLCKSLVEAGVVHGIDWTLLRSLPASPQRFFQLFFIAAGSAPISGTDGQVIDCYPREPKPAAHAPEPNHADEHALHLVQEIGKDDVICRIVPPTHGTPGSTVTGTMLPASDGAPAPVPQGRNTVLSEDGTCLLAACAGHLGFSGRNFLVKPVLHIRETDLKENHSIKYLGDVHIHCDLSGDVSVCAIGTVQVDGVVEGCTIEAGEHLILSSGVQGQDTAVLHAQKGIYAKYLEHCRVYAQESVHSDCIINCTVYSNGTVQARTGRGVILGGTIRAARGVSAITVGSKAEPVTHFFLGGLPCEEAERTQVLQEVQRLEAELAQAAGDPARLSKLRLNQCVARMKLEKFDRELESRTPNYLECDERRLTCDTAYPGTTVVIAKNTFHVEQAQQNCIIAFTGGRIGCL